MPANNNQKAQTLGQYKRATTRYPVTVPETNAPVMLPYNNAMHNGALCRYSYPIHQLATPPSPAIEVTPAANAVKTSQQAQQTSTKATDTATNKKEPVKTESPPEPKPTETKPTHTKQSTVTPPLPANTPVKPANPPALPDYTSTSVVFPTPNKANTPEKPQTQQNRKPNPLDYRQPQHNPSPPNPQAARQNQVPPNTKPIRRALPDNNLQT